jgi:bis(5'-nucleosidyl)-tetraphosphatase
MTSEKGIWKAEEHSAGFVIYRRLAKKRIEYLLLQATGPSQHWTPPKGHVEAHEAPIEAAFRELLEETGIDKTRLTFMSYSRTLHYHARGVPKDATYWLARLEDGARGGEVVLSKEHQAYVWAQSKEAIELARYPEMQKLLYDCDKFLRAEVEK